MNIGREARGSKLKTGFRLVFSLGCLLALAWLLDARAIAARLTSLRLGWAVAALAISAVLMALSALRWRLTAARLGVALPFRTALAEYYLAVFLNQLLPGGVMGDVSRAWRHARAHADTREAGEGTARVSPAVRAVILERASGQVVMLAVAALSLFCLPVTVAVRGPVVALVLVVGAALLGAIVWLVRRGPAAALLARAGRDVRDALLARDAIGAQLLTSTVVTGCFVAMYVAAARAVSVQTPVAVLAPLVAPVLVSMLIPATVAGWGIREATAAGLWSAVGMRAEDGVAISAAYGVLVLVSSLPGAVLLLSAGRDRTARPRPDGTSGSGDGSRR